MHQGKETFADNVAQDQSAQTSTLNRCYSVCYYIVTEATLSAFMSQDIIDLLADSVALRSDSVDMQFDTELNCPYLPSALFSFDTSHIKPAELTRWSMIADNNDCVNASI